MAFVYDSSNSFIYKMIFFLLLYPKTADFLIVSFCKPAIKPLLLNKSKTFTLKYKYAIINIVFKSSYKGRNNMMLNNDKICLKYMRLWNKSRFF